MRTSIKIAGIVAGTSLIFAAAVSPAMADTSEVSGTVIGGDLTFTTSPVTLTGVQLDGKTVQSATGTAETAWSVTDARGTGAPWSLSVSGTDFTSAAGTVDTILRTITIDNLILTPGDITAGAGSDVAPTASPLPMSTAPQSLVATTGSGMGSYTFTPSFDLSIPVNSFRSNLSAGVGTIENPYVSVITYTVS